MRYYIYNYISDSRKENFTVIFDSWPDFLERDILEELKEFHSFNEQCANTIYLGPSIPQRNDALIDKLLNITGKKKEQIFIILFNEDGFINSNTELVHELVLHGLINILKTRNAILESDDSFHYVLPSGKHSPFFIRTGNILSKSEEINFIALCTLNKIRNWDISQIACDTSSILHIPYAINYLRNLFGKKLHVPFDNFGSYGNEKDFNFIPRTLVLISASNSGNLIKKIKRREKDLDFLTLISNYDLNTEETLLDIRSIMPQILNNKSSIQVDPGHDCKYCNVNSIPVVVSGEQFIPSRILLQKVLITKFHVPSWINKTANLFVESDSILANKKDKADSKKRELYLDVKKLINSDSTALFGEFKKYIKNFIPNSVNIVIHLEDSSSKLIAEKILQILGRQVKLIGQKSVKNQLSPDEENTILVVAACITTGHKFNSLSRELRDYENSSIHYLSIVSRLHDSKKLDVLRKNLEYRDKASKKNNINKYHSVVDIYLNDFHDQLFNRSQKPNWDNELIFWRECNFKDSPLVQTRIKQLESQDGLMNNLFFESPFPSDEKQKTLRLRKNFALFDFKKKPADGFLCASQADVFFILSALFHYLRFPHHVEVDRKFEGDRYLIQHEHVRTLLDQGCFTRYNDGIIQACILRIANHSELNYSISEIESLKMLETLKDLFKDSSDSKSNEGILEFLYALASGKLKLQEYHKMAFVSFIEEKFSQIQEIRLFLDIISGIQRK